MIDCAAASAASFRLKEKRGKQFFFEKKNQKTFVTLAGCWGQRRRLMRCPGIKTFVTLAIACGADGASPHVPGHKVFLLLFVHKKKSSFTLSCHYDFESILTKK
jgi:hypothetical protein